MHSLDYIIKKISQHIYTRDTNVKMHSYRLKYLYLMIKYFGAFISDYLPRILKFKLKPSIRSTARFCKFIL